MVYDHAVEPGNLQVGDHIYVWCGRFGSWVKLHSHHGIVVKRGTADYGFMDTRVVDRNNTASFGDWSKVQVKKWITRWGFAGHAAQAVEGKALVDENGELRGDVIEGTFRARCWWH